MSDDGQRVTILMDGEGKLGFLGKARHVRDATITHLAALPSGMASGRASVAVVARLKDGSYALLQTSMRIMLTAAAQWLARYGTEGDGTGSPPNEATRDRLNVALLLKLIQDREGGEVTFDIAELNAVMQDASQGFEVTYSEDGRRITLRAGTSE